MSLDSIFTLLAAVAGVLFSLLFVFIVMPKIENECKLPMPKLPSYWFGHAWQFLNIKRLLQTNMEWFRECGEVFQIWIFHHHVVVTANPDDVVYILGKPSLFARPPAQVALFNDLQPDNFQTMSRKVHRAHRNHFRESLSPNVVRDFSPVVSRATNTLIERMKKVSGQPVNFTPEIADTTFSVLLEAVLGSTMSKQKRSDFAKVSHQLLRELLIEYFSFPLRRVFAFTGVRRNLFRKHQAVLSFARDIVQTRLAEDSEQRSKRTRNILDTICELDPSDLRRQMSNTSMFAIAGFESSSEAIAWSVYELCGRPDFMRSIQVEIDNVLGDKANIEFDDVQRLHLLRQAWKEALRLHPAAGFMLRVAQRDVTLPGSHVRIPKGVQVGTLISGAQRNPRFISDPDDFRPERWAPSSNNRVPPSAFIPFSCGPERCPGQALADYEGVLILAVLLRNFDLELACERNQVVPISDWTERARGPAPGSSAGDKSWSLPVRMTQRR